MSSLDISAFEGRSIASTATASYPAVPVALSTRVSPLMVHFSSNQEMHPFLHNTRNQSTA
jgi:hypothetical protein